MPEVSQLAEEFKQLDGIRRQAGLSPNDAERYHHLYAQLSEALASVERRRRVNTRQFLRVTFPMRLRLRTASGAQAVDCLNFGGGGCAMVSSASLETGDDVWLDGVELDGVEHPLHGRAQIAWRRAATDGTAAHGYGLRFCIDSAPMRDQVDRLLYRVLDRFLASPQTPARG